MIERRFLPGAVVVRSDEGAAPVIRGHAAVFNEWFTLYEDSDIAIRERIIPGAFDNAVRENQDVRALFNHDANLILGRTKSGTCRLSIDSRGLFYEADPPDTQAGRDVVTLLRRGDVDGSSFAMTIRRGGAVLTRREDADTGKRYIERDVTDVNLFDVSPVVYPAYSGASSGVRSSYFDTFDEKFIEAEKALRAEEAKSSAMRSRYRRLRLHQTCDPGGGK